MAEPPPIRRPVTNPPPIPTVPRPAAAGPKSDVITRPGEELAEDTRKFEAQSSGPLLERMLELVGSEAEALLATTNATGRLAELNVRSALAQWDALHQPEQALQLLELAERHPLAPRLRLSAAVAAKGPDALATVEAALRAAPGLRAHPALALELAEAWLRRDRRADRAAALADELLAGDVPEAWRAHVAELAALAHAKCGAWDRVAKLREVGPAHAPDLIAATAALLLDRLGDAPAALAACWAKLEHYPGAAAIVDAGPVAIGWLRAFDVAIAAASVLDDARRFELLDKRAELIALLPHGALEALATRHAIASELDRDTQHAEAAATWARLADEPAAQQPGAARRIANLRAAWSASAAGEAHRGAALAAHRRLADDACRPVAASHAWRALELAAVVGDPAVGELARAVAGAAGGSPPSAGSISSRRPTGAAALARFERAAGSRCAGPPRSPSGATSRRARSSCGRAPRSTARPRRRAIT